MAKGDVTEVKTTSSALAIVESFEADAGAGLEQMDKDDFALPFLKALTNNSDEIGVVEGAMPGMIFNTVTKELFDGKKGLVVVPTAYVRQYIEWAPRGSGSSGAPVQIYSATSDILSRTHRVSGDSKDYLDNGNYIELTANHYVMVVDDGGLPFPALIVMKSTQLKKSRKWNSMMMSVKLMGKNGPYTPPIYSQMYRLTTVQESNDKGKWYGWEIERIGSIPAEQLALVYGPAKQFAESVNRGEVKVKHESENGDVAGGNIPF